jgi:hypothetical protein
MIGPSAPRFPRRASLLAFLVPLSPGLGVPPDRPADLVLNGDTFRSWQEIICPRPDELVWRRIPWRTSLQGALEEAHSGDKPLLLWLMNGHPLGCT